MRYDEVLDELEAGKAGSGLPCSRVRALLNALGFHVKDGASGAHKTVTHPGLSEFHATGYNCRGGNNGTVDRNYLRILIRVVRTYKDEIRRYLGES